MPSMDTRMTAIEKALIKHLEESGEIRNDIKWLKKLGYFVVSSPLITEIVHHIWK